MTTDDSFKVSCPYCSQHIRVFPEHIGMEINCPTCGGLLLIPDPNQFVSDSAQESLTLSTPEQNIEIPPGFQQEEWILLQEEDYDIVERIVQLNREMWWECGALGIMIEARLRIIHDHIYPAREIFYHPGTQEEHIAYLYFLDQKIRDFFDIQNFIYRIMTHDLLRVCVRNNLLAIIQFAHSLGREITRLRDFHDQLYEHSLPQEQPFPEIQDIIVNWAPYIYERLSECSHQLLEKYHGPRGAWSDARLHSSFFPPTIPQLFTLRMRLHQRYALNISK
ncbi:MAG: hypothetical protein QXH91_08655 [Candidatus Bathyarchaeia archaeon]